MYEVMFRTTGFGTITSTDTQQHQVYLVPQQQLEQLRMCLFVFRRRWLVGESCCGCKDFFEAITASTLLKKVDGCSHDS